MDPKINIQAERLRMSTYIHKQSIFYQQYISSLSASLKSNNHPSASGWKAHFKVHVNKPGAATSCAATGGPASCKQHPNMDAFVLISFQSPYVTITCIIAKHMQNTRRSIIIHQIWITHKTCLPPLHDSDLSLGRMYSITFKKRKPSPALGWSIRRQQPPVACRMRWRTRQPSKGTSEHNKGWRRMCLMAFLLPDNSGCKLRRGEGDAQGCALQFDTMHVERRRCISPLDRQLRCTTRYYLIFSHLPDVLECIAVSKARHTLLC